MADCAGLLNRCRDLNPYREFESHPLRDLNYFWADVSASVFFLSPKGGGRRISGGLQKKLEILDVEHAPEFFAHTAEVRDFHKAQLFVKPYARRVPCGYARNERADSPAAALLHKGADKSLANSPPDSVGGDIHGGFEGAGVGGFLLPRVGVAVARDFPAVVEDIKRAMRRNFANALGEVGRGHRLGVERGVACGNVAVVDCRNLRGVGNFGGSNHRKGI